MPAGCAPSARAGQGTGTRELPADHEPFTRQTESLFPEQAPCIEVKSYTQTVLSLTWGQVLIGRTGQRDLKRLLFVINVVFLARISYLDCLLTDRSKEI